MTNTEFIAKFKKDSGELRKYITHIGVLEAVDTFYATEPLPEGVTKMSEEDLAALLKDCYNMCDGTLVPETVQGDGKTAARMMAAPEPEPVAEVQAEPEVTPEEKPTETTPEPVAEEKSTEKKHTTNSKSKAKPEAEEVSTSAE